MSFVISGKSIGGRPIIFGLSEKSGCTQMVRLFFDMIGDKRYQSHSWIHNYREEYEKENKNIYEKEYISKTLSLENTFSVRLVRNPYDRAVSSYFHMCKYKMYEQSIPHFFQKKFDDLSFVDFIKLMESRRDEAKDGHFAAQKFYFDGKFKNIVHLSVIEKSLNDILKSQFPEIRYEQFDSDHHNLKVKTEYGLCSNRKFSDFFKKIPNHNMFYDKEIADRVYNIYKEDFLEFGFKRDSWEII